MSITLGDISVRYVNLMLDTAEHLGVKTASLRQQFSLSTSLLSQAQGRISIPKFMRLGYEVIGATNCPQLGLEMGRRAQLSLMGISGFCAACAPTLQQSLMDIARFESLSSKNSRGHSTFYSEGKNAVAEFYSLQPYNDFNFFIVDLALTAQANVILQMSQQTVAPKMVQVEFEAPLYADAYRDFFECPIKFSQPRNALVFEQSKLRLSPALMNSVAYEECRLVCNAQLIDAQKKLTFQERVMNEISTLLQSPELGIEQVANRLDMPVWTLRRQLKNEHTSYTQLLDNTRQALAVIYLKDKQYTVNEVAYLLGFTYPNAFHRAFKRWEGIPPGEYRALRV